MPGVLRQPALHDLVTCIASPTVVLSGADGQVRESGAQGAFVADVRVISRAELLVGGVEPESVRWVPAGAGGAMFVGMLRGLGDAGADPTVWVRRHRVATPAGCTETIVVENVCTVPIETIVDVVFAADLAGIATVKRGAAASRAALHVVAGGFEIRHQQLAAQVLGNGAQATPVDGGGRLRWRVTVPARGRTGVSWSLKVEDSNAVVVAALAPSPFVAPVVTADDRRIAPFVMRSVEDLAALRMCTAANPDAQFLAAGSPWYLTLFGRDSLWAARMLLPLGTRLAHGTLATLAARQGISRDGGTAEEPGKILHELRRGDSPVGEATLPPVYYGTVDATPLWVCLLADAWRWGMEPDAVQALIPAAERALNWMAEFGDGDSDGFLEYAGRPGHGLVNQGWKDSADSVRFADGRIASGPVALAEVQGYAYEAAVAGADLLAEFGRPDADRWRAYAARLAEAFRARFWVTDDLGAYPAMALDGDKRPVDAPASNMGHLLASGMLTDAEAASVAARLVHPTMSSGFGLRTMSSASGGYSPLSYHCGSVWPHDTAIAIHGLVRSGFTEQAAVLAEGLLAAGAAFAGRLPELYGGFAASDIPVPVPYPASCRPQAWSAAASVVMLQAFLGVSVDVPHGLVRVTPPGRIGALRVAGLRVGGRDLTVAVDAEGVGKAEWAGGDLRMQVGHRTPPSTT